MNLFLCLIDSSSFYYVFIDLSAHIPTIDFVIPYYFFVYGSKYYLVLFQIGWDTIL